MRDRGLKLLRLEIAGSYKGLKDQSFDFSRSSDNIITFVGLNGSGKSQLLELIAEVFGYLERARRPDFRIRSPLPFAVLLEYQICPLLDVDECETYRLSMDQAGNIDCHYLVDNAWKESALNDVDLPQHVIGYASGLNENLQRSFLKNAVQYFDVMSARSARRKRLTGKLNEEQVAELELYYLRRYPGIFSLNQPPDMDEAEWEGDPMDGTLPSLLEKDTEIPASIFLDYDCNALLMASLAILSNERMDKLFPEIAFRYMRHICVQYDFRGVPVEEDAIRDITQLVAVVGVDAVEGISDRSSDEDYDLYELDYLAGVIHIDLTRDGLRDRLSERYYGLPIRLFEKLYKIQLLGVKYWSGIDKKHLRNDDFFGTVKKPLKGKLPLAITELKLSNGVDVIDFDDLSDGEAQLVQVVSAAHIFNPDNTLFIFDEPETHLNPSWRTHFHKNLNNAAGSDNKRLQFLLSTHSPFLISSLRKENVYRFERNEDAVVMWPVESESYGASFDSLIKEFFGLKSLISQTAVEDIRRHLQDERLNNDQRKKWIEENIGDSTEKAYLLRRLGN